MPTWRLLVGFRQDLKNLTPQQKAAFQKAVARFVADLRAGKFRKGLRVKKMSGHADVWEMTWAPDGRATFQYGEEIRPGEQHIIWRRIGSHDIFDRP
jgi:mRNA-degrading endonuclease YafQ of YafQ-DinJ toxin-antitoxin module